MDESQLFVTGCGAIAAVWVVWFFFLGERTKTRGVAAAGSIKEVKKKEVKKVEGSAP